MVKKIKPSKTCQGLICLADINGFTRYLSSSTLKKSPERIALLLNGITQSNRLGMKIAEIEGDAVFFYMLRDSLPHPSALITQCAKMYRDFQENLQHLNSEIHENTIEESARKKLGLKIILHYGEFSLVEMAGREKPMGETVLVAHQLLKNSLNVEEYLLITQDCVSALFSDETRLSRLLGSRLEAGEERYDYIGWVKYLACDLRDIRPLKGIKEYNKESQYGNQQGQHKNHIGPL